MLFPLSGWEWGKYCGSCSSRTQPLWLEQNCPPLPTEEQRSSDDKCVAIDNLSSDRGWGWVGVLWPRRADQHHQGVNLYGVADSTFRRCLTQPPLGAWSAWPGHLGSWSSCQELVQVDPPGTGVAAAPAASCSVLGPECRAGPTQLAQVTRGHGTYICDGFTPANCCFCFPGAVAYYILLA